MWKKRQYKSMFSIAAGCVISFLFCSCNSNTDIDKIPEDNLIQIQPVLSGSLIADGFATGTRADSLPGNPVIVPLPEGSTLWIIAEKLDEADNVIFTSMTAYVVKEVSEGTGVTSLYPCEVDDDGNLLSIDGTPMFISEGKYKFWAVSPARELDEGNYTSVKNGEELLATDERYTETAPTNIDVSANWSDDESRIEVIKLNPLFNQTAQLKFTITSEAQWIHSLELLASGVEYSGLQEKTVNNWSLTSHLQTDYGMKNGTYRETECVTGKNSDGTHYLEVTTPILPVNAIATPVVVLFNVLINGVPSPFSIMLTEKDFKAGYSYHYKGRVKLQDGVAVIVWQFVEWGTDVVFD